MSETQFDSQNNEQLNDLIFAIKFNSFPYLQLLKYYKTDSYIYIQGK